MTEFYSISDALYEEHPVRLGVEAALKEMHIEMRLFRHKRVADCSGWVTAGYRLGAILSINGKELVVKIDIDYPMDKRYDFEDPTVADISAAIQKSLENPIDFSLGISWQYDSFLASGATAYALKHPELHPIFRTIAFQFYAECLEQGIDKYWFSDESTSRKPDRYYEGRSFDHNKWRQLKEKYNAREFLGKYNYVLFSDGSIVQRINGIVPGLTEPPEILLENALRTIDKVQKEAQEAVQELGWWSAQKLSDEEWDDFFSGKKKDLYTEEEVIKLLQKQQKDARGDLKERAIQELKKRGLKATKQNVKEEMKRLRNS